jgi:hypothetical protein
MSMADRRFRSIFRKRSNLLPGSVIAAPYIGFSTEFILSAVELDQVFRDQLETS